MEEEGLEVIVCCCAFMSNIVSNEEEEEVGDEEDVDDNDALVETSPVEDADTDGLWLSSVCIWLLDPTARELTQAPETRDANNDDDDDDDDNDVVKDDEDDKFLLATNDCRFSNLSPMISWTLCIS